MADTEDDKPFEKEGSTESKLEAPPKKKAAKKKATKKKVVKKKVAKKKVAKKSLETEEAVEKEVATQAAPEIPKEVSVEPAEQVPEAEEPSAASHVKPTASPEESKDAEMNFIYGLWAVIAVICIIFINLLSK